MSRLPEPISRSSHRRTYGLVAGLAAFMGGILAIDHLQRQPSGALLQASAVPWVWENENFGIQLDSLRLVSNGHAPLLTGAISRGSTAAPESLPPGALLEMQLPDWIAQRQQQLLQQLPSTGSSLPGRLLQEALQAAVQQAISAGSDAASDELARQWLHFTDRQFIAPLGHTPQLQITASLGQKPLLLRPAGNASTWLLGSNAQGEHLWSQPAFTSTDQGATWTLSTQQMPGAIDQQAWANPETGVAWQRLEHGLLLTQDGGQTWAQPRVETPLTKAPRPAIAPDDAPAMVRAWRESTSLRSLDPDLWGDLAHDPAIDARHETLLSRTADGHIRGWSTRWTRTVQDADSDRRSYGEWKAVLTRSFGLEVHTPGVVRITDLHNDTMAPAIDDNASEPWMTAPDGSISVQRDEQLHHWDATTSQSLPAVTLPHRSLHKPFMRHQVWVGHQAWIVHTESLSVLDIATCLLPRRMPAAQRCDHPSAQTYYASRDRGRSWTPFQLPKHRHQRVLGWDEHAQKLLVAHAPSAPEVHLHHQLELTHYPLPE